MRGNLPRRKRRIVEPALKQSRAQNCPVMEVPILDVRSPGEFAAGSLPGTVNLPILTNEERAAVGLRYRKQGREAAIALGEDLVSGKIKSTRVAAWKGFAESNPRAMLCCARGGMRSEYAQGWLAEAGIALDRVEGGYKALRNRCLKVIECRPSKLRLIVVGGRTGSGKTELLLEYSASIDLEGLANHRGSAFGALNAPQPSQATMENALACELLRFAPEESLLLEDESRAIGSRSLPMPLYEAMSQAPIVVIELDREQRARRIFTQYVSQAGHAGAPSQLHRRFADSLQRIRKRLGDRNFQRINALLEAAFESNSQEAHLEWISALLADYYDPMYDHGLKRKAQRIVMHGSREEVKAWIDKQVGAGHGLAPTSFELRFKEHLQPPRASR